MNLTSEVEKREVKSWFLWGTVAVLAATVVYIVAQPLTVAYLSEQEIKVAPFTIKLEGTDYKFVPEGHHFMTEVVARRSDGALVSSHTIYGGYDQRGAKTRKISFPDGEMISISDSASAYTRWPKRAAPAIAGIKARLLSSSADCVRPGERLLEEGDLLGQKVVVVQLPLLGDQKSTVWRAIELACQTLQTRVEAQLSDGSYKLRSEIKPLEIVMNEPDPTLFEVPSDYTSLKPSEIFRKESDRLGLAWGADTQKAADNADAVYFGQPQSKKTVSGSTGHATGN